MLSGDSHSSAQILAIFTPWNKMQNTESYFSLNLSLTAVFHNQL